MSSESGWMEFDEPKVLKAEYVLDDAMSAIWKWSHGPIEKGVESRIIYAAAISLLRAVGHVSHKVDCKEHPEFSVVVKHRFTRWKMGDGRGRISPHFIETERNLLLKEYAPNWNPSNQVELNFMPHVFDGAHQPSQDSKKLQGKLSKNLEGKTISTILMPDGIFAGYSFDELLVKAATWWGNELREIKKGLAT